MDDRWQFLSELGSELEKAGVHDLGQGISTILSDLLIDALATEDRTGLDAAQDALERFYLARLNKAPDEAALAARGEDEGSTAAAAAFALGQVGLAHAVAARAASKRVDDEFERRLRSRQFERCVRLLADAELSGREIAERLGKDEADISRRMKLLRQIGAVECRREGNRVVNFLTPAARAVMRARNMGALVPGTVAQKLPTDVAEALDQHRSELPASMRHPVVIVFAGDRRRSL